MSTWRADIILQLIGGHPNMPANTDVYGLTSVAESKLTPEESSVVIEGLITATLALHKHWVSHGQIELKNLYVVGGTFKLYGWDKAVIVEDKTRLTADFDAVKRCIAELINGKNPFVYQMAIKMPTIQKMAAMCDIKTVETKQRYAKCTMLDLSKSKNKTVSVLRIQYDFSTTDITTFLDSMYGGDEKVDKIINFLRAKADYIIKTPENIREKLIWRCLDYRPVGYQRLTPNLFTEKIQSDILAAAQFLLSNHINHGAFVLDNFRLIDGAYRLVNFGAAVFGKQNVKQIQALIPDFEYKTAAPTVVLTQRAPYTCEQRACDLMSMNYTDDALAIFNMIARSRVWSNFGYDAEFKKIIAYMCGDDSVRNTDWVNAVRF